MADVAAHTEKGLLKTFLTGASLPFVWLGCSLTRQEKPDWLTKELRYTGKVARDVSFAFGMVCGLSGFTASIWQAEKCLIDAFVASTKAEIINPIRDVPVSPEKDDYLLEDVPADRDYEPPTLQYIPYILPKPEDVPARQPLMV